MKYQIDVKVSNLMKRGQDWQRERLEPLPTKVEERCIHEHLRAYEDTKEERV